jgi:hypothetical protein
MARIVTISTAAVSQAMAAYTIGFVKLEVHNKVEDAIGAGSGTLVSVGKVPQACYAALLSDATPDWLARNEVVPFRWPAGTSSTSPGAQSQQQDRQETVAKSRAPERDDSSRTAWTGFSEARPPASTIGWAAPNRTLRVRSHEGVPW